MPDTQVMLHVRFSPDGSVYEISERPTGLSPQIWFEHLSKSSTSNYQVLSGGRGVFRLTREQLDTLKHAVAQLGAA